MTELEMRGAIEYMESFPIDKKSYIRIHFNEWIHKIFETKKIRIARNAPIVGLIPDDKRIVIDNEVLCSTPMYEPDLQQAYSSIMRRIKYIFPDKEDEKLKDFCLDIMKMESYDNNTIASLFKYVNSSWYNNFKSDFDDLQRDEKSIKKITSQLEFILFTVLMYKVGARTIYSGLFSEIRDADNMSNYYHNTYESTLLLSITNCYKQMANEFDLTELENNIAILLYLLLTPLKLKATNTFDMLYSLLDYTHSNGSNVKKICDKLERQDTDTLELIGHLSGTNIVPEGMNQIIVNHVRVGVEELYTKNKISEACGSTVLIFGDGLPENIIKQDLLIDAKSMTPEEIGKYAPSKIIEYDIPADDKMFIEHELQYKKVVIKDSSLKHEIYILMIPIEGVERLFICFKCLGDPIIYALSLDKDSEKTRTLVTMEKNEAARYMMLYGKEIEHGND